jgi:hypothetical protein
MSRATASQSTGTLPIGDFPDSLLFEFVYYTEAYPNFTGTEVKSPWIFPVPEWEAAARPATGKIHWYSLNPTLSV